jgi:hypothetical protein
MVGQVATAWRRAGLAFLRLIGVSAAAYGIGNTVRTVRNLDASLETAVWLAGLASLSSTPGKISKGEVRGAEFPHTGSR